MKLTFSKYHGTGNDFVIIDDRQNSIEISPSTIASICHRRFGIGADGLMLLRSHPEYDFEMVYYNSDGHPSSMCGNGGRCLVTFAQSLGIIDGKAHFIAIDGQHSAKIDSEYVHLKMNDLALWDTQDDHIILDTGSPHYVRIVQSDVSINDNFIEQAKEVRYSHTFKAAGINVNHVQLLGDSSIKMRTYERGVEDETLSCGTGAVAAALATHINGHMGSGQHEITIYTPGGKLKVSFSFENERYTDVTLIGPAVRVFDGEIEIPAP